MKLAIVSITANGAELAFRLNEKLGGKADLFERVNRESAHKNDKIQYYEKTRIVFTDIWSKYDAIICIMATGIVVRDIKDLLKHKSVDPAIIVMDEKGINCISLLSGHLGGANDLVRKIAKTIGANPVITTATDVNNLVAPDAISNELNLAIEDFSLLKTINSNLVAGDKIDFLVDDSLPECTEFIEKASNKGIDFVAFNKSTKINNQVGTVLVAEKNYIKASSPILYLRPKSLVVGMGCRSGIKQEELYSALKKAVEQIDYSLKSIKAITSAWVKNEEQGLLELADLLRVPIYFYTQEQLAATVKKYNLAESAFVKEQIGVGNVCEAAILSYKEKVQLVKKKESYNKITVALGRVNFML